MSLVDQRPKKGRKAHILSTGPIFGPLFGYIEVLKLKLTFFFFVRFAT